MKKSICAVCCLVLLTILIFPCMATEMEEELSLTLPEGTEMPAPDDAPMIDEVRVNSHLVVLAYRDRQDGTWDFPDIDQEGLPVPRLYQNDFQGAVCEYDGEARSVSTSGCSVTCLSMALYYLTGDSFQTPTTLFREACLNGMYVGNGVKMTDLETLAQSHGVRAQRMSGTKDIIRQALQAGYPILCATGEGYFGKGHYIVLRGIGEDDSVYVNDPNSRPKSQKTYPLAYVVKQLTGKLPLLIIMPAEE